MSLRQVSTNTQNFFEQQDLFYAGSDRIEYTVYFCHIRHVCFTNQWRSQEFLFRERSTNSVEDRGQRERRFGGGSPLVRDSGGSCNLVQEISYHIVKFS